MRFLADENFPGDAVTALRAVGHDVAWIRTDAPGSSDPDVLARAVKEGRILLTFDKDFGELAWRSSLPTGCGIVLFRMPISAQSKTVALLTDILTGRTDWAGYFAVVEPGRIRMRPLPFVP